jgi:hypothetical protein
MSYANTPGVKIKEVSLLPPSIVQVSTAIPVFLGYTEKGTKGEAIRITSLKAYEEQFGKGKEYTFTVNGNNGIYTATPPTDMDFFLYEAMQLYFMNGGGPCYIISVGLTTATPIAALDFIDSSANWMESIEKLDEPSIIAFPEAVALGDTEYGSVVAAALKVCNNTKDKIALIDSPKDSNLLDFASAGNLEEFRGEITGTPSYGAAYYPPMETVVKVAIDTGNSNLPTGTGSAAYLAAMAAINKVANITLPPSPMIAAVYAKNDRENGFWKAPANIALQGVIKPSVAISDAAQANLNVDATAGKSINAIRYFAGKGNLVWGARTLDGNNNEWRYISVRRLFMTVEESVNKATSQFVFENNDAKTWVKVSSMIKSYLNGLWKEGALMGATPDQAYFVEVGLNTTMTAEDVYAGKMIVKVGLAAVRPAEFIILEFSHVIGQ